MKIKNVLSTPQALLRGVFLLPILATLTLFSSCKDEKPTPDWLETTANQESTTEENPAETKSPRKPAIKPDTNSSETVSFMAYNLENYLIMDRYDPAQKKRVMLPKPEKEITALLAIIKESNPDILGICEIGTKADLADLQNKLKALDVEYPYNHFAAGADPYRRLAILSKFPIQPHPSPELGYRMNNEDHLVNRGILDCTILLPTTPVRFVGTHLKSKRKVQNYDEAVMRRNEATVVRRHIDKVLTSDPNTPLMVYGDFNDTKRSAPIKAIKGPSSGPLSLYYLDVRAPDGSKWTHYWDYEDIYSRFDYAFVSPPLRKLVDFKKSHIVAPHAFNPASDHRPLLIIIRPKK